MPKVTIVTPSIRPAGLDPVMAGLEKQTNQDFEWLTEISCPWKGHDLNAAMNRVLRRAKGDIVISLQDYITVSNDLVQRVCDLHDQYPMGFMTFPMGKIQEDGSIKFDWRVKGEFRRIAGFEWETDLAYAPMQMFRDIGGYDETYDQGWSWDNASVGIRGELAGYIPSVYPYLRGVAVDHDAIFKHPFRGKKENGDLHRMREEDYRKGNWKLNYL